MGLFDIFNKKQKELPEKVQKWNKMWELWENDEATSPYAELMTYESEVNNGGHEQFFDNVSNVDDLDAVVKQLYSALPTILHDNLKLAHEAYLRLGDDYDDTDELDSICDECDDVFYENEALLIKLLEEYADRIEL